MTSKTIKEFAEFLNLDKKKLEDKLRYQKKNFGKEFGTISAGRKMLSEAEQIQICELLNIPVFVRNVHHNFGTSSTTENPEKISYLENQNSDLKNQLLEIKKDKDYLQNQLSQESAANSELRILLQQSIKQTDKLQIELTELHTEILKLEPSQNIEEALFKDQLEPTEISIGKIKEQPTGLKALFKSWFKNNT